MTDGKNLKISSHAIDKYLNETGCRKDREYAEKRLLELYEKSTQVDLPSDIRVTRLLRNGVEQATYHEYAQWRMVVVGSVMVTFERKFRTKKAVKK